METTYLKIGLTLAALVTAVMLFGCDNATANPFQRLYYQQLMITDSIKTDLTDKINQVSIISNKKIDSLKIVERDLKWLLQNAVCDSAEIIRKHYQTVVTPYIFEPLNKRLMEIIDSLNRK